MKDRHYRFYTVEEGDTVVQFGQHLHGGCLKDRLLQGYVIHFEYVMAVGRQVLDYAKTARERLRAAASRFLEDENENGCEPS